MTLFMKSLDLEGTTFRLNTVFNFYVFFLIGSTIQKLKSKPKVNNYLP